MTVSILQLCRLIWKYCEYDRSQEGLTAAEVLPGVQARRLGERLGSWSHDPFDSEINCQEGLPILLENRDRSSRRKAQTATLNGVQDLTFVVLANRSGGCSCSGLAAKLLGIRMVARYQLLQMSPLMGKGANL